MSFDNIKSKLMELFREGNRRRLVVQKDGKRYANIPLSIVVLACFLVFWLVALLAVIAFFLECKFSIETDEADDAPASPEPLAVTLPVVETESAPVVDLFDEAEATASTATSAAPSPESPADVAPPVTESPTAPRPAHSLDDLR